MAVHSIDEDQILQMIKIFEGYQDNFTTTFLERKSESNIENLDTTIQDELRQACIYIGDKQAFGKEVVYKALEIFNNVRASMMIKSQRLIGFQNKVEELEREIVRLQSSIKILEQENQTSENNNEALRKRVGELEKGIEENQKNMNEDKDVIKESMYAYSELSQNSIMKEKDLISENQKINLMVNQYKQEIEKLKYQIEGHKEERGELNKKIHQHENKLNLLQHEKETLQTRQLELESIILNYEQQLKQRSVRSTGRKYSDREQFSLGMMDKEKDKSVVIDMRNLNQQFKETEIIFEQEDVFAYTNILIQKANSQHYLGDFQAKVSKQGSEKKQQKKQEKKQQKQKQKQKQSSKKPNNQQTINRMMIDPYYAHFILTSQSVKIRLDHDQFLGIDFQKYYKQVMESGVQMHNWPTWIESKLKQLTPGR